MEQEKRYLKLNDIECYKIAFHLSNKVWNTVMNWDRLAQYTVGEQIIRSTDSISANIAEGFGRYGKKDKVKFYRIAYASMLESLDWNEKAKARNLISRDEYSYIFDQLQKLPKAINSLIKFTNEKLKN